MHRNMGGIGNQFAIGIKDGAGKIEPVFDVGRPRRSLQSVAHLFGDVHEAVVEDFQQDRIHGSRCRLTALLLLRSRQN